MAGLSLFPDNILVPDVLTSVRLVSRIVRTGKNDGRRTDRDSKEIIRFIKGKASQPVSRVLSSTVIHLRYLFPGYLKRLPENRNGPPRPDVCPGVFLFVFLRAGFTLPPPSLSERWSLTPPFHPYPGAFSTRAVYFLLHFPLSRDTWPLTSALALRSSDFPPADNPRATVQLTR